MSNFDQEIFTGKTYSKLLEEIYNNQKKKETQITALIAELKPLINDIGDATLIVPLIKEYMELGIKNDDALIKMATIIQRSLQKSTSEDSFGITDDEKEQLLTEINKIHDKNKD
jgi:predicted ATP-grasp superfamily ATP-dependent carboligase